MFLVPSFCMVGNGFFVPGPFLVGFGGMKVGMSVMHLTLFSNLTVNSPYIHAPNLIAGFHVKVMPRIFVWIPVPHAQSWSRHCECCLVCLAVLRRHWTQQVQKRRLLFARNHALHAWTLSLCVYACTRGSCVDSIWLWVRMETFSKPVFGVSKPSISAFVAVGPHCVCMLAVVVAVLIAYDYDCARTLWASRPFGGEAALARRESLQLRPCWPNIEPQMIGQKEEKKSWVARPVSQTNQRPPKPALNREGNKLWVRKLTPFLGPDLVLQTSFLRMHVHLKVNPWRIHLPCQLTRLQKHDSRSCVQLSQKIVALCPLWWFQPPILQHVFSCAQWGPTATKPEMLVFETPKTGPM